MKAGKLSKLGEVALGGAISKLRLSPSSRQACAILADRDEAAMLGWDDGGRLAVTARIGTGAPLPKKPKLTEKRFLDLAYDPSGERIALAGIARAVEVYDARSGKLERELGEKTTDREDEVKRAVAMYDAVGGPSKEVLAGIRLAFATPSPESYTAVGFSADGKLVFATAREQCQSFVFDRASGKTLSTFWGGQDQVAFAPHPEGELVAMIETSWGERAAFGTVRFGRIDKGRFRIYRRAVELDGLRPHGAVWSPNGRKLACVGIESSSVLAVIDFPSCEILYEIPDLTAKRKGPLPHLVLAPPWTESVIWSPDAEKLLFPFPTGDLILIDAPSGKAEQKLSAHEGLVVSCGSRPAERLLLTAGIDGVVRLFRSPFVGTPPVLSGEVTRAFTKSTKPVKGVAASGALDLVDADAPTRPINKL